MTRIQIIAIVISFLFLLYTSRLIIKGKLREEYAVIWWVCAGFLLLFSVWSNGLDFFARLLGVIVPSNLIFSALIFVILIYLLHLSRVNSKLQQNVTRLTQEIALLKQQIEGENTNKKIEKDDAH